MKLTRHATLHWEDKLNFTQNSFSYLPVVTDRSLSKTPWSLKEKGERGGNKTKKRRNRRTLIQKNNLSEISCPTSIIIRVLFPQGFTFHWLTMSNLKTWVFKYLAFSEQTWYIQVGYSPYHLLETFCWLTQLSQYSLLFHYNQ